MNTENAKIILSAVQYRAEPDSDTEGAFALLERDPALREWFEQEQEFDHAITSKLAEIQPPADLEAKLIALVNESAEPNQAAEPKNVTWFKPPLLAAAAAVILIPLLAIQLLTGEAEANSLDAFRNDMVELSVGDFKLDHTDGELSGIYKWLEDNDATCPTELATNIDVKSSIGCKVLQWNNEDVTLICLRNDSDQVVHCFVLPREEFTQLPKNGLDGSRVTMSDLETSCWTDADFVYFMVGANKDVKLPTPKMQ